MGKRIERVAMCCVQCNVKFVGQSGVVKCRDRQEGDVYGAVLESRTMSALASLES